MIDISTALLHYKRYDIQKEIIMNAKDREVAVKYGDKGFGTRPDVLAYEKDVLEFVKQNATSFHASEELWRNPLQLNPNMNRREQDDLRIGWDLVIDIDCKILDYSKIAADLVVKMLKFHNIQSVSTKFSGNKGFHIGIPFESFPEKVHNQETRLLFPEAARKIALYLRDLIKKPLAEEILRFEHGKLEHITRKTGLQAKDIIYYETNKYNEKIPKLNCEPFLGIDTILISSRHLYRMPYSLHEKSGLCSIPIDPNKILEFDLKNADPKNVIISKFRFLDKSKIHRDEAKQLLVQAMDYNVKSEEEIAEKKEYDEITDFVPEELFPPCIKKIFEGMQDGKKRALFILINFLVKMNWPYDKIEARLREWNQKNPESLREQYLLGQLRYHKQQKKKVPPPNCAMSMYYQDLRIKCPDDICSKFKNPMNYSFARVSAIARNKPSKKSKGESQ